jgi:hypothetical protein
MTIEYKVAIATKRTPADMCRRLEVGSPLNAARGGFSGPGINDADVLNQSDVGASTMLETHGFKPTVAVLMHVDKFNVEVGERTVADVLDFILTFVPDDAALVYNHELVLAVRKDKVLTLSETSDFWTPSHLQRIKMPYRMGVLGNLE